jgi:hypothetical protein
MPSLSGSPLNKAESPVFKHTSSESTFIPTSKLQSKFTQNQNLLAVCVDSEIKKSLKVKRIEAAPDYHNALKETSFQIRTCMKSLCDI